jgi:chemotaxis signal transduction protein
VVTQAIAPDFITAAAIRQEAQGDLLTLVRMEIGGLRFVAPLADVAAVIEPTSMEAFDDDPQGIWIGTIASRQGAISIASGPRLLRIGNGAARPGRLAILRGEHPVGLAVDRVLGARTVPRDAISMLPATVVALENVPISGSIWGEDDEIELMLDTEALVADLDAGPLDSQHAGRQRHSYRQNVIERYGQVDYRRALEVRFNGSAERWVLPMSIVRLVTDMPRPHTLPRAPHRVAGLLAWNRNPIPVIDPTYQLEIPLPVARPARLVVIGEPAEVGAPSESADAALMVGNVVGIHNNLRLEHGYAWDRANDALNIMRIMDILS